MQLAFGGLALIVVVSVFVLRQAPTAAPQTAADGSAPAARRVRLDAVARLQQKIDSGDVTLEFDRGCGYLSSLLKHLNIPVSSQLLVFSKSSAQMSGISPSRPRAVYFNDDVYVGWVQEGGLELSAVDPASVRSSTRSRRRKTATQLRAAHEQLRRLPRFLGRSGASHPAAAQVVRRAGSGGAGHSIGRARDHRSKSVQRTLGRLVRHRERTAGRSHMGNQTFRAPAGDLRKHPGVHRERRPDARSERHRPDRPLRHETYLTPHSDIVALMVLGHQSHVYNLITVAIQAWRSRSKPSRRHHDLVKELGEPIVRAMLFSGEARLDRSRGRHVEFCRRFREAGPARQPRPIAARSRSQERDCCGIR